MKLTRNKTSALMVALLLGALSTLLTGCIIWPWHDHDGGGRDHHDNFDHHDDHHEDHH